MSEKAMDFLNNKIVGIVACIVIVLMIVLLLHFLGLCLYKIVGVSGTMFGFFSAIWFIRGLLMSDEKINKITLITKQTHGEITIPPQNIEARDSLKGERENAIIGTIFLLFAFIFQSLGLLIA